MTYRDEDPNFFLYDANTTVSGTYFEIVVPGECVSIRLYPVSGVPVIFLNVKENLPALNLYEATTLENVDGRIKKVIVYGASSVTVNVKLIRAIRGQQVRV